MRAVQASQNLGMHSYFLGRTNILRLSPGHMYSEKCDHEPVNDHRTRHSVSCTSEQTSYLGSDLASRRLLLTSWKVMMFLLHYPWVEARVLCCLHILKTVCSYIASGSSYKI
jgi:hypothetical protein